MKIVCIHQGYELYGSDRCFIESVSAFRNAYPAADIEVVLPREGPIVPALEPLASRIVFEPLFVLRRKALLRLLLTGAYILPAAVFRAARRCARADLIYVNTSVIVDYQIAARAFARKTLLHIHEIPTGAALKVLRALARFSGARIVFNSCATRDAFDLRHTAQEVIYNGLDAPAQITPTNYDGARPLRVALLGRINHYKGQDVLLAALIRLDPQTRARFRVRMVGGAFENPAMEEKLRHDVEAAGLSEIVTIEPFAADPAPVYDWADIVAVPSKMPEALGRTAIEAMAFGRPPIVSATGGLKEVVVDGETGWQVPPRDPTALAAKLADIVAHPEGWGDFGWRGRARYEAVFSPKVVAEALCAAAARCLTREPRRPAPRPVLTAKT